jgi:hypothetical protein
MSSLSYSYQEDDTLNIISNIKNLQNLKLLNQILQYVNSLIPTSNVENILHSQRVIRDPSIILKIGMVTQEFFFNSKNEPNVPSDFKEKIEVYISNHYWQELRVYLKEVIKGIKIT